MKILIVALVCVLLGATLWLDQAGGLDMNKAVSFNQKGEKLLQKSEFRQALDAYSEMKGACGTDKYCNAIALFNISRCQAELGSYDEALAGLREALALFSELNKTLEKAKALHGMGKIFSAKTDYNAAMNYFEEARAILERIGKDGRIDLFWVLTEMASANIYLSGQEQAGKNLEQAEALMGGKLLPVQEAFLQYLRGRIAQDGQDYKAAMELYDSSLKYFDASGDRKRVQSILNSQGLMDEHMADYPNALKKYQRALAIAQGLKDQPELAFIYNNMGSVHWKMGNYKEAVNHYNEALAIRKKLDVRLLYGDTLNNLGIVQIAYGNYPTAFENFRQAYDIAKDIGSAAHQAWALHDMAWVFKDQGDLMRSQRFSLQALDLANSTPDRRLKATVLLRLGNLYEYYGNFEDALKKYEEAEGLQREIGDRLYRGNTLMDMANVYTRKGVPGPAEDNFEKALKIKKQIGAATGEALCKFALFYLEKDQYSEQLQTSAPQNRREDLARADKYLKEAERTLGPEDKNDLMLLRYVRGRYLLEVDPERSIEQFNELINLSKSAHSLKYSFLGSVGLGLAYEKRKRLDEAEKAFDDAVQYAESIRKTLDPEAKRTFLHGEEILGMKHVVPYEGLARVRLEKGDRARSLEASEFTKARSFADQIARRIPGTTFGVDARLLEELDDVENKMRANHRQLDECTAKGGDSSLVPELRKLGGKLVEYLTALEKKIRSNYPDFHAVRFPAPRDLDGSRLREDEVVLAYDVTDSGVLIYLVKGKKVVDAVFKAMPRDRLDNLVRRFREPFDAAKLNSFDFAAGKSLYDLLVADFIPSLAESQPVVVVPDDCLTVLPFEMLVAGGPGQILAGDRGFPVVQGAQFLGDRHPIIYYQSITALSLARALKHKAQSSRVLVVANPETGTSSEDDARSATVTEDRKAEIEREIERKFKEKSEARERIVEQNLLSAKTYRALSSAFQPLPETQKLAEYLQQTYGAQADVLTGSQATLTAFLKEIVPKISGYDKIVFATHGYFGEGFRPEIEEPILLMSLIPPRADNLLRMSTVMDLKLNADLVSLVACQSGLGKRISGEGTMGMGRAFQYAGAKSVLMSLWSVEEQASVQLVQNLLDHTRNGVNKLEALKRAREQLRKDGWDHPFFWAAFILVGEAA